MLKRTEYISHGMINRHMQTLSNRDNEDAIDVEHLDNYLGAISSIAGGLSTRCEKIPFKKGMHALMTDPKTDYEDIVSNLFSYDDDEGRKMMEFVWTHLWPDEPIPTEPLPNVEVIGMGYNRFADDWDVARGWYYHTKQGDTMREIAKKLGVVLQSIHNLNAGNYPADDDAPIEENRTVRLREYGHCIARDDRGLYFHELPKKAQQTLVEEIGVKPSGAVCPFEGSWMLTRVDGKSVDFVPRHFDEGEVLPEVEGKPAQWRYLLDHSDTDN